MFCFYSSNAFFYASTRELEKKKNTRPNHCNEQADNDFRADENKFETNLSSDDQLTDTETCLTQISVSCKTEYLPPKKIVCAIQNENQSECRQW